MPKLPINISSSKIPTEGGTKEMSKIAFAGGLSVAIIIDIIGIFVPIIGTIFIVFMRLSFWLVGYDMRNSAVMTTVNGLLECLPVVPSCTIFMLLAYKKNKANITERKKG